MRDYAGNPIRKIDVAEAMEDWEERDGTSLPESLAVQWTKLWIAHEDGALNDRQFHEQYLALTKAADKLRGVSETAGANPEQPEGQSQVSEPSETAGGDDTGTELRQAPAPKVTTKKKRVAKPAQVDVGGSVWPADFYAMVEQTWNRDIAGPAAIAPFDRLADGQKYMLLDAVKNGNDEAQGEAVKKIIDELSDVAYSKTTAVPSEKQLSEAAITQVVEKLLLPFSRKPPVLIRGSETEVLGESRSAGADDGDVAAGMVFKGKIHLFRDGLTDTSHVARTLWHEMLHYGLRRFLTKEQYIAKMLGSINGNNWGFPGALSMAASFA